MKKEFLIFMILLVLTLPSVFSLRISSKNAIVSIAGETFNGKAISYLNLRQFREGCYGYVSFIFNGENENSTARMHVTARVKNTPCMLTNDIIFLSQKANVYYNINQKHVRIFDYITRFGYTHWKWIMTGRKIRHRAKENVIFLVTGNELGIYSQHFGVYNLKI